MNKDTEYLIQEWALEIYRQGGNRSYLLCVTSKLGGTSFNEIDYEVAEKLMLNEIYMAYSVNLQVPCKENFVMPYKIIDKIIDQKSNIILIAEEIKNITVK
ncbi:hypothetical protein CF095_19010 [Clostridium botulinum]